MAYPRVAVIGPGAVGCAIGRRLHQRGYPVVAVAGRTWASARRGAAFIGENVVAARSAASAARRAELILITTADGAIESVCRQIVLAGAVTPGDIVMHCCGAHGLELLASARAQGARTVALHPVQSFASAEQALQRLKGTWFTCDGDPDAKPVVKRLVRALGGRLAAGAPSNRAAYHAALCALSNYTVALADACRIMLDASGMAPEDAAAAMMPLLRGTVENIAAVGVPDALTGPIARGDVATVAGHLEALAALPDAVGALYRTLGLHAVDVALRKGTLTAAGARTLRRLLESGPRN